MYIKIPKLIGCTKLLYAEKFISSLEFLILLDGLNSYKPLSVIASSKYT